MTPFCAKHVPKQMCQKAKTAFPSAVCSFLGHIEGIRLQSDPGYFGKLSTDVESFFVLWGFEENLLDLLAR